MRKVRKNLILGMTLICAAVTGYYLEYTEQHSYTLELASSADIIPQKEASGVPDKPEKININTATAQQLQSLPGIGESKAEEIIEFRQTRRPFEKIEDIMLVSGIGEKIFDDIKEYISVE